mmetsp:Transcript_23130/g.60878  ORF Transcript_23130/g.60878 Transcript_23130/m.60878 type:complete len:366 (-) Transcript_23130:503-1600(-)
MRVRPLLCSVPVLAESLRREVSILESSQGSSAFDLCENSTAESLHGAAAKDEESASKSRTVSLSCSAAASARQSRRQSRSSFRESMSNALAVALSPPASPPPSPSSTIDGQPVETIGQSRRGSAAPTTSNLRSLRMMPKMATTRNLRHFAQQNGEEDDLKCSTLRRPEDSLDGRQLIAVIMAVNKVDLKTDRAGKPFDDVEDVESAKLYASILAELHSKASKVRAADVLARFDKNKLNRLDALKPKRRKSTVMGVLGVMGAVAIKRSETSSEGNEDDPSSPSMRMFVSRQRSRGQNVRASARVSSASRSGSGMNTSSEKNLLAPAQSAASLAGGVGAIRTARQEEAALKLQAVLRGQVVRESSSL